MSIKVRNIEVHWNYLLAIEDDLERIARFVEFDERNFGCFSIEISRVLMAAAAEVDVVAKQLCKKLTSGSKADSIGQYQREIRAAYPDIHKFQVLLPRYGMTLQPWSNWRRANRVPEWWTANNKIKHHRHAKFHFGSLNNMLNAVAGLFILVLYLYREKAESGELVPSPTLLRLTDDRYRGITYADLELGLVYVLEDP